MLFFFFFLSFFGQVSSCSFVVKTRRAMKRCHRLLKLSQDSCGIRKSPKFFGCLGGGGNPQKAIETTTKCAIKDQRSRAGAFGAQTTLQQFEFGVLVRAYPQSRVGRTGNGGKMIRCPDALVLNSVITMYYNTRPTQHVSTDRSEAILGFVLLCTM